MPGKMAVLLDMIGVGDDARGFENAVFGSDENYGTPRIDLGQGFDGVLFPPLISDS
jgi:methionyl-tRNA synthetase